MLRNTEQAVMRTDDARNSFSIRKPDFMQTHIKIPEPLLGSANVIAYKQKDRKKPTLGFRAVLKTS